MYNDAVNEAELRKEKSSLMKSIVYENEVCLSKEVNKYYDPP